MGLRLQAFAAWRWWNHAESRVPAGKTPLRINLDETSVALFQGGSRGTIFFRKKKQRPEEEPVERASLGKRRRCLTHVGLICDRRELQPLLPQVLIGNFSTFLVRDWEALTADLPGNVYLVRQKSAWNNVAVCLSIIRLLSSVLRPYLDVFQPVLLMDACPLHLHHSIARACAVNGIWLVVVPARLTWLLQPLDTHAFHRYKIYLRSAYQMSRANSPNGELSVGEFLRCIYETIRFVLQGQQWAHAFDEDGFGQQQAKVSAYARRQMELGAAPSVDSSLPTSADLQLCYPRRARVPVAELLRPYLPQLRVAIGYRLLPSSRAFKLVELWTCIVESVCHEQGCVRGRKQMRHGGQRGGGQGLARNMPGLRPQAGEGRRCLRVCVVYS